MSSSTTTATTRPTRNTRRAHGGKLRRLTRRDGLVLGLMLGVPLIVDLAFIWGPAIASIFYSFTDAQGARPVKWVGGKNYHFMATVDYEFWPAIWHNVLWLLVFIVIATPLGMLFAVLLDRGIKGSRVYQSMFFLPVMLSLALIGIIWQLMYAPDNGLINNLIGKTGQGNQIDWLGDPNINLWAVLVEATWRQAGYVMVLYLAGLKAVNPSLREAASLDGANEWKMFWRVVFPTMRPINIVILVVTVIESLRAFDLVYITNGGTNGLELLSAMITQQILGAGNKIGYGSALGVVLLAISIGPIIYFLTVQFRKEKQ
ncbi:MAG: sugar ABC transporter permease [Nakamurella sp.]